MNDRKCVCQHVKLHPVHLQEELILWALWVCNLWLRQVRVHGLQSYTCNPRFCDPAAAMMGPAVEALHIVLLEAARA